MASLTHDFVHYMAKYAQLPGPRHDLRSGIGQRMERAPQMHPHVAAWVRPSMQHETEAYYCVAALIAHRPDRAIPTGHAGDLGASLARADFLTVDTRENWLRRLSRQPPTQITTTLGRIAPRLIDSDVPVDFVRLLDDLAAWPRHRRRITARWNQSFYRILYPVNLPH